MLYCIFFYGFISQNYSVETFWILAPAAEESILLLPTGFIKKQTAHVQDNRITQAWIVLQLWFFKARLICVLIFYKRKVSKYGVFSGPYFPAFRLNTEIYGIDLRIRSAYRKIRTRKMSVFGLYSRSAHPTANINTKALETTIFSQNQKIKCLSMNFTYINMRICCGLMFAKGVIHHSDKEDSLLK